MPQLGETVTEGTILSWAVAVGDEVAVDSTLFEVSTEKVDTEVPSPVAGFVRALAVEAGETVPIGEWLVVITATPDETFDLPTGPAVETSPDLPVTAPDQPVASSERIGPDRSPDLDRSPDPGPAPPPGSPPGEPSPRSDTADALVLTPVVRRLLSEKGLSPDQVLGSGREGRITRADVLAAAAQIRVATRSSSPGPGSAHGEPAPVEESAGSVVAAPAEAVSVERSVTEAPAREAPAAAAPLAPLEPGDEVIDFTRARAATAANLTRSLASAAHALVVNQVDYAHLDPIRRSSGLSYLAFVARALVDAIREYPHVNASVDGEALVVRRSVHLGIAVDVDQRALVVPVIRNADGLRIGAIADAVTDLADRARRHRLSGEALSGGTITLTNVGAHGTVLAAPIINWPQVAILSIDGVRMAPTAVRTDDGHGEAEWGMAVHPVGNLSLSFDHRAFDGAYAAAFLARVREILETRDWGREMGTP